jgi:hypothetical protein
MKKKSQRKRQEILIPKEELNGINCYYDFCGGLGGLELFFKDVNKFPVRICIPSNIAKKMVLSYLKRRKTIKAIHINGSEKAFIGGRGR